MQNNPLPLAQGTGSQGIATATRENVTTRYLTSPRALLGKSESRNLTFHILSNDPNRIKKAYRRKALELHPDRNLSNVEASTREFAAVQSAFEILSDPQERAWYDSHRTAILTGDSDGEDASAAYEYNARMTTSQEIIRILGTFRGQIDFSDSQYGFFGTLSSLFERLAEEENAESQWNSVQPIAYPGFGSANDNYEAVVKPFYAAWTGFATQKSFSWRDTYKYSEAPDRRIRRLMEKENRRLRGEGIREFNDAVRSLVAFVKRRDPRVKLGHENEAARQKVLREAAAAQAARSRAVNELKVTKTEAIPSWVKSSEPEDVTSSEDESSISQQDQYECVLCNKIFKSENQYAAHEKSKKHAKTLRQLQKEMQQEDDVLSLQNAQTLVGESSKDSASTSISGDGKPHIDAETIAIGEDMPSNQSGLPKPIKKDQDGFREHSANIDSPQIFETPDMNATSPKCFGQEDSTAESAHVHARVVQDDHEVAPLRQEFASQSLTETEQSRVGKAKQKRAKKARQQAASSNDKATSLPGCAACGAGFPSKTQLFNHIKDFGHARPPKAAPAGKRSKR